MKRRPDSSPSASRADGDPGKALDRKRVAAIKKRLATGESAYSVAKAMEVGYMAVYKIGIGETWKDVEPKGRLIPEREAGTTPEQRDWAWRKKRKGWSGSKIARKLGLSETTVSRLLREARQLLAARVHQMYLTSGSHEAAQTEFRLSSDEMEELLTLATTTTLPRKLRKELAE